MLDVEGYVTTWNAGARRMKGYNAEEILGRHFSSLFTAEDQEKKATKGASYCTYERPLRRRGMADAEGWQPLLGQHHHHTHL